jgi:hypothetical protein
MINQVSLCSKIQTAIFALEGYLESFREKMVPQGFALAKFTLEIFLCTSVNLNSFFLENNIWQS